MSDDEALLTLAQEAGLQARWTDTNGTVQTAGIDTLRAVLAALDLRAGSRAESDETRARLRRDKAPTPPLIVAGAGEEGFVDGGNVAEKHTESRRRKALRCE